MKRAFVSLYLLIVAALLVLGWGLDRFWESYQQPSPGGAHLARIIAGLAGDDPQLQQTRQLVQILNRSEAVEITLLPKAQLTGRRILERLGEGEAIEFTDANNRYLYQPLGNHPYVLVIRQDLATRAHPWLKPALALLFYSVIALVIFLWLWPLARDLARLEHHTRTLGVNNRYEQMTLPRHPTAYRLGLAFNRMAERIGELINVQQEMTHAVSHELRTPLARMKFALAMADQHRDELPLQAQLESLRTDVEEMDQLINQLLNYARLEHSQPELTQTSGDMQAMVDDIAQRLLKGAEPGKRIRVLPATGEFVCNWGLMERALINLMQNALRYCHSEVIVTLCNTDTGYRALVDDDGPGITVAERERVFESFTRVRETPECQGAGFGLGLAIVRRVIRWHGGSARVSDAPAGGARFILEWPKAV